MEEIVDFENFLNVWTADIHEGDPSCVELGRRFAHKMLTQWRDADPAPGDLVYCDGTGDGGIDAALLDRGEDEMGSDDSRSGHTWYLIQSKYGSAFQGTSTLLQEGQKVIDTLNGNRHRLSSLAEGLLQRLTEFRNTAGDNDRIILVFATERPLLAEQKVVLSDLRNMGRGRLGSIFETEAVSVETIYQRNLDQAARADADRVRVKIRGHLVATGQDSFVGAVALPDLYAFLTAYRNHTQDLDRLYEKNVRRFLGNRRKVNKAIQDTLREAPERFGLYNNGITIVVSGFRHTNKDQIEIEFDDPYVVNGCQTTRTIWEVCQQKYDAGGTGKNPELEEWKQRANQGLVVTKIVNVGAAGEELLRAITRYTNSQNAVKEQDFLALTSDFRMWSQQMASKYNVYLEIQRGGWDSRRAFQKQNPTTTQFQVHANAFDLIKVYGAGWLGEAGLAFGKNPPFLPNGTVFNRIVDQEGVEEGEHFGVDDLYAAFLVEQAAIRHQFGRGAPKPSRRQTRYLFYMVVVELLRDVFLRAQRRSTPRALSRTLIQLLDPQDESIGDRLLDIAAEMIDSYMTQGSDNSIFEEPAYREAFNYDLNGFLKWEQLGKTEQSCPRFRSLLAITRQTMGIKIGGHPSVRDALTAALTN